MSYYIEFQPQELNLVWNILLNGQVSGKDAPILTAVLQNIQDSVERQDAASPRSDESMVTPAEEFQIPASDNAEENKSAE